MPQGPEIRRVAEVVADALVGRRSGERIEVVRFRVFGRADRSCYNCGERRQRKQVNGCRLYWCYACQQ